MHPPGSLTRYFWLKAIERSSWTILFSNSVFNKYTFLSFLTVCRVCFTGALEDLKAHVSKSITVKNAVPAKIFPLIFTVGPLSFNNLYCIRLVFRRFSGALQVLNVRQKKAYVFCLATTHRRRMTRFHSRVSFALFQKGVVCCMQGMQSREGHSLPISMPSPCTWAMWKAFNLSSSEYTKRYSHIPAFG